MSSLQFKAVVNDDALAAEIRRKFFPSSDITSKPTEIRDFESLPADAFESAKKTSEANIIERIGIDRGFEAIVERFGRPSLPVKNGTFEIPSADTWKARLFPTQSRLDKAIRSVGRLELINHSYSWAGTAWIIAEGVAVTNRHVADLFAQKSGGGGFAFRHNPLGESFGAKIDFKEEHLQPEALEIEIAEILYVAENIDGYPDLAFLRLKRGDSQFLPPPIPLFDHEPSPGQTIAVIGYPAYDDRNNASDMTRIFGDVYGVKRFAPGEILDAYEGGFTHDCTTLGGNSGSAVIDVKTGAAVGLHFAGEYLQANFAVSALRLKEFLNDKIGADKIILPNPAGTFTGSGSGDGTSSDDSGNGSSSTTTISQDERPQPRLEEVSDRNGYDSGFLGDTAELNVPLPKLSAALQSKAAAVDGATGSEKYVLKYTNFSVVMNRERRLAFYTATNIDGATIRRIKRKGDSWFYDPRIPHEAQVGNELYRDNDLDRVHLTRRLDPAWGEKFKQAEEDTFFFTNCTPQHHLFNTKTWLSLEDYLLETAETKDFRASVFTGPIFSGEDRLYEFRLKDKSIDRILIPLQYWKVVVMVNAGTESLSATAYMISQKDLISRLEFVFGRFKTYQLPIQTIENLTGLDFGNLKNYDPLKKIEGATARELNRLAEIII